LAQNKDFFMDFEIVKLPIPKITHQIKVIRISYPFNIMAPGDSFLSPFTGKKSIAKMRAITCTKSTRSGKKFLCSVVRHEGIEKIQVWRSPDDVDVKPIIVEPEATGRWGGKTDAERTAELAEAERMARIEEYAIAETARAKASGYGERPTGAFFDSFDPVVPVAPAKPFTFFGPISDADRALGAKGWGSTPPIEPPATDALDDPDPCSNCGHEITEHPYTGWGEPCETYVP
jgi:hypothetical protein